MTDSIKPPVWFWVVAILALIWNLMGVFAYLGQAFMTPEAMEALPENQRQLIDQTPAWATAAFAIAVWGGLLASILLLIRKKLAYIVFIISFAGIVIQMVHSLFIANSIEVYGPGGLIMPTLVILFAVVLILIANKGKKVGWLK